MTAVSISAFVLAFVALGLTFANAPAMLAGTAVALSLVAATSVGVLDPVGLIGIGLLLVFAAVASLERSERLLRLENAALLLLLVVCIALALHVVPGFNNPLVVPLTLISPDALPYRLHWSYDKLMAGLALIAVIQQRRDLKLDARIKASPLLAGALTIGIVLLLGWGLGMVRFDPKLPSLLLWWVPANLLITSVAEEAFFRGIVLALVVRALARYRHGTWIALLLASILFGTAHFAGGLPYVALSSLAGVGYGLVYLATGRLAWSIGLHFALNLTHMLLFTYPMLAG